MLGGTSSRLALHGPRTDRYTDVVRVVRTGPPRYSAHAIVIEQRLAETEGL